MSRRLTAFAGVMIAGALTLVPVLAVAQDAPSGSITVLTHRTDRLEDGTYDRYLAAFNEQYPDVSISFEGITDYEGEVAIRMATPDYGDVLMIPNSVRADQLGTFFEPLGTLDELSQQYNFITEKAFDGTVYGITIVGNAQGLVYNKKVWEEAGVTELPTTPEAFIAALQLIKDNTDSIPFYTNYADGWPMTQWEGNRGSITANPNYVNELAHTDAPWTEGSDHYVIDKLLYDIVAAGLNEEDPTTTAWEPSKDLIGSGEIATMLLGSWAIVQMQQAAANPDDIGYMPFPSQVDGVSWSTAGGDYHQGINVNSQNKEAARAWLDWFANESGFSSDEQGIPPAIGGEFPAALAAFDELGVQYISQLPAPAGEEGWVDNIDNEAEVGLWQPIYRQRIIDAARGATGESLDDIFTDLNTRWAAARAEVTGG